MKFPRTPATLAMSILCCFVVSLCFMKANAFPFIHKLQQDFCPQCVFPEGDTGKHFSYLDMTSDKEIICPNQDVTFTITVKNKGRERCGTSNPPTYCEDKNLGSPYNISWTIPSGATILSGCGRTDTTCKVIPASGTPVGSQFCVSASANWSGTRVCTTNGVTTTSQCLLGGSATKCVTLSKSVLTDFTIVADPISSVDPKKPRQSCDKVTFTATDEKYSLPTCPPTDVIYKWDFGEGDNNWSEPYGRFAEGKSVKHIFRTLGPSNDGLFNVKCEAYQNNVIVLTRYKLIKIYGFSKPAPPATSPAPAIEVSDITPEPKATSPIKIRIKWNPSPTESVTPQIPNLKYRVYRTEVSNGQPVSAPKIVGTLDAAYGVPKTWFVNGRYQYDDTQFQDSDRGKTFCYQVTCFVSCDGGGELESDKLPLTVPDANIPTCITIGGCPAGAFSLGNIDIKVNGVTVAAPQIIDTEKPVTFSVAIKCSDNTSGITYDWVLEAVDPLGIKETQGGATSTVTHTYHKAYASLIVTVVARKQINGVWTVATQQQVIAVAKSEKKPGNPATCDCMGGAGGNKGATKVSINAMTGELSLEVEDPTLTRGLPLDATIHVSSQAVEIDRPMANGTFAYDAHIYKKTVTQQETLPDGTTGPVDVTLYYLVDGTGERHFIAQKSDIGGFQITKSPDFYADLQPPTNGIGTWKVSNSAGIGAITQAGLSVLDFDEDGKLVKITDAVGLTQTMSYSGSGQLTQVLDTSTGKYLSFTWGSVGSTSRIIEVKPSGTTAKMTLEYHYTGNLEKINTVKADGTIMRYTKYGYNNGDGTITSVYYDDDVDSFSSFSYGNWTGSDGNPVPYVSSGKYLNSNDVKYSPTYIDGFALANNPSSEYAFLNSENAFVTKDYLNNAVYFVKKATGYGSYTYAGYNVYGDVTYTDIKDGIGSAAHYTYNDKHELIKVQDNTGMAQYTYNDRGMVLTTTVTNGLGVRVFTTVYDGDGIRPVSGNDPLGATGSISYDAILRGAVTQVSDGTYQWTSTINATGQTLSVTPPNGSPTGASSISYYESGDNPNYLGYPKQATDAQGNYVTFDAYTALGDVTSISSYVAGVTHTTQMVYDDAQRVKQVIAPNGAQTFYNYTGRNLTSVVDAENKTTNFEYCSPCGAMTRVWQSIENSQTWSLYWQYDTQGQLTKFTDARGYATLYGYGSTGELRTVKYPGETQTAATIDYMPDGKLLSTKNARNQVATIGYDAAERVKTVTTPEGPFTYTYRSGDTGVATAYGSGDDLLKKIEGPNGYNIFYYKDEQTTATGHGNRWLTGVQSNLNGLSATEFVSYYYNPDGSVNQMAWSSGNQTVATYQYSYNANGSVSYVSMSTAFGSTTPDKASYTYDGEGKLLTQTNNNGTILNVSYDEVNQKMGWPVSYNWSKSGSAFADYNLQYDNGQNRVARLTGITGSTMSKSFTYDALGRLTSETNGSAPQSFNYDLAGNLGGNSTTFTPTNQLPASFATYDLDGNTTSKTLGGSGVYTYDSAGHILTQKTSTNAPTISYAYDNMGHRVKRTVGGVSTFYIFAGDTLIGETDASGNPSVIYTWGVNGLISARRISSNAVAGGGATASAKTKAGVNGIGKGKTNNFATAKNLSKNVIAKGKSGKATNQNTMKAAATMRAGATVKVLATAKMGQVQRVRGRVPARQFLLLARLGQRITITSGQVEKPNS